MFNLLRNNMPLQVLLILAALVLLWIGPLTEAPAMTASHGDGILYTLLAGLFAAVPRAAVITAMILVLAEGVLLNKILADINIVPRTTLLPTLMYVVFMSANASTLTPMIIVAATIITCSNQLMLRSTLLTIPTVQICSATALIGIGTLFYIPSVAFVVAFIIVAINYRLYSWRDIAATILGFLAPYLMLVIVLFFTDGHAAWWSATVDALGAFAIRTQAVASLPLTANLLLALFFVISSFVLWAKMGEHTVVWQKNTSTIMLAAIGSTVMLFYSRLLPVDLSFFAIPFALSGTLLFMPAIKTPVGGSRRKRHLWIYDILLIMILVAAYIC